MARGGRRKAERPASRARGPVLLALVALLALVVTSVALAVGPSGEVAAPSAPATPQPGPLGLGNLPLARALSCEALDDAAVTTALGAAPTGAAGYTRGDRVEVVPGVIDTVDEDLCSFEAPGARARVWVFGAAMSPERARRLVADLRRTPRCAFPTGTTRFGTPGLTSVCSRGEAVVTTLRGLFDDAWLSCELTVDAPAAPDAVRARANRWCVHVATTLGARP